jgi:hypothetical protein
MADLIALLININAQRGGGNGGHNGGHNGGYGYQAKPSRISKD